MSLYDNLQSHFFDETKKSVSSTYKTAEAFKEGIEDTIRQISRGFQLTMYMYFMVFLIGCVLLAVSAYLAIATDKEFISSMFGGMGMASVLSFFFSKTPIALQKSRGQLAQLQTILFNWYVDVFNWNSYLLKNQDLSFEDFKRVSDIQMKRTEETVEIISGFLKEEFSGKEQS